MYLVFLGLRFWVNVVEFWFIVVVVVAAVVVLSKRLDQCHCIRYDYVWHMYLGSHPYTWVEKGSSTPQTPTHPHTTIPSCDDDADDISLSVPRIDRLYQQQQLLLNPHHIFLRVWSWCLSFGYRDRRRRRIPENKFPWQENNDGYVSLFIIY